MEKAGGQSGEWGGAHARRTKIDADKEDTLEQENSDNVPIPNRDVGAHGVRALPSKIDALHFPAFFP